MEVKENLPQCDAETVVSIPLSRLEHLLDTETRAAMLEQYTQGERYCISREKVAHYLGFELKEYKED